MHITEASLMQQPLRVCIVDDDPTALAAATAALSERFDITVARSGQDALRLIGRHPPDVVLLDVEMPGMDGMAVCQQLKADPLTEHLPVVFLTAHGDEATELRGLAAGATDFVAKPARGPVVAARLQNLGRMKRMAEQLRIESQTDSLTGLQNRGQLDRLLQHEILRALRHRLPLSLLLIDIDHFKAYNDRYGHLAGDGALRQVAQALKAAVRRAGDQACRYGGEEFALLLPGTDLAGAGRMADNVLRAVADLVVPHAGSTTAPHLTLSLGMAGLTPDTDPEFNPESARQAGALPEALLAAADTALYAAKHHGRNQAWRQVAGSLQFEARGPIHALPPTSSAD
jgi:diguanylate cyclase (GGDEF)-like protein